MLLIIQFLERTLCAYSLMRNAIVFQETEPEDVVRIIKSQTIPEAINLFSHNIMAEDRDVINSMGIKRLA